MTRYTVVWVKDSQGELADIWLNAPDRNAVTAATEAVDRQLSIDAPDKGIELSEVLRAFFAPPLRVLFAVNEGDRLVEVLCVKSL